MKKIALIIVLAFGLVGGVAAQHRGGYNGGHNSGQHNGYNGQQHNSFQRHNGPNFGKVLLGTVALAGTAVVLNSIFSPQPQPVYYQQPIIVDQPPVQCSYVQQRVIDRQGRPLYDQYSGQPLVRQVRVCSSPVQY